MDPGFLVILSAIRDKVKTIYRMSMGYVKAMSLEFATSGELATMINARQSPRPSDTGCASGFKICVCAPSMVCCLCEYGGPHRTKCSGGCPKKRHVAWLPDL